MSAPGPLAQFFAQYEPAFTYNSNNSVSAEWKRLCDVMAWNKQERDRAHHAFKVAVTKQFNESFGREVDNVASWQVLLEHIGIQPPPDTVKECKKAVKAVYVNIYDLLDAVSQGKQAQTFPTEKELSKYTKKDGKIFPRSEIHAGDLLKFLLRGISRPRAGPKT